MGDNIEDNVWEGVNDVDLSKNINSDDDVDSSFNGDEIDFQQNTKLLKTKQKLAALKESKKTKAAANALESSYRNMSQLSVTEMIFEIDKGRKSNVQSKFTTKNFFYPNFSLPQTKSKSKKECPYVRALAVGLPSYKKLLQSPDESGRRGSPTVLIICASAVRATQIIRSISSKIIKCKIAKLFAKHIKISEQVDLLAASAYPLAIGTPNRLLKLIQIGSLELQKTLIVLVDFTQDVKGSTILTMKDVNNDFYSLLDEHISKEIDHIRIALVSG